MAETDTEKSQVNEIRGHVEDPPREFREECQENLYGSETSELIVNNNAEIDWTKIGKLPSECVKDYSQLRTPSMEGAQKMLEKLIVIKLNVDSGNSLGHLGPKSSITVRDRLSFLDLAVQQMLHLNNVYDANVPMVLVNSCMTHEDTLKILRRYEGLMLQIYAFSLSCPDPVLTVDRNPDNGDFYDSFKKSGLLDKFVNEGRTYCFISNVDNLGASVDMNIYDFLFKAQTPPEFVIEVTDKTKPDIKSDTLIYYENKLRLLETSEFPNDYLKDLKFLRTFKFLNTNNIWVHLPAIKRMLECGLLNKNNLGNRNLGAKDMQSDIIIAAAMHSFDTCIGISVARSRFIPVKTTADMFLVMSNLYSILNGRLVKSPAREFPTMPEVKLCEPHFSNFADLSKRFASIPNIIDLDHLTVVGDVTFGRDVVLKGTVIIKAKDGDRIDIPSGSVLENKIVLGNLRILDH